MTHYHSKEIGCKLVDKMIIGADSHKIRGKRCITHKIDICFCGYEWGWHYGIESEHPRGRNKK